MTASKTVDLTSAFTSITELTSKLDNFSHQISSSRVTPTPITSSQPVESDPLLLHQLKSQLAMVQYDLHKATQITIEYEQKMATLNKQLEEKKDEATQAQKFLEK